MRAHELGAGLVLDLAYESLGSVARDLKKKLARQRIAVGMESGRRQPNNHVANLGLLACNDALTLHNPHDEPSDVVLAIGIEAGHLSGLSPDQRAAVLATRVGDSG